MAKKCVPGLFCVGNMTLFVLVLILLGVVYLVIQGQRKQPHLPSTVQPNIVVVPQSTSSHGDGINNITSSIGLPPLKFPSIFGLPSPSTPGVNLGNPAVNLGNPAVNLGNPMIALDGVGMPVRDMSRVAVPVPVQIPTRGYPSSYQQMGILTSDTRKDMILPLMGRQTTTGRDKWHYYTVSNSGAIQTKLPVSRAGRSCTSEYGCDELYNGDTVFVEGYKEVFRATIYENAGLAYNPF
jgi:hypothetical protein